MSSRRDEIARFAAKHALGAEAVAELEALCGAGVAGRLSAMDTLALDTVAPVGPEEPIAVPLGDGRRYEDLGLIGTGGMGEVRRVRDTVLNRVMAMKVIRAELLGHPTVLPRFIEEAQATAQLEHPGIVPVHELGRLEDGRFYFTMKEVRGRTLGRVLREVHAGSDGGSGWSFRRLIDAFLRVCDAVGYAHARGVVHRDLKPDNVMVGEFGEVLVVDWGLARVTGRRDFAAEAGDLEVTERVLEGSRITGAGAIEGTPAYMSPEQARGDVAALNARSDVYALGAILYEILGGRPPYEGGQAVSVLEQVLAGPPPPPVSPQGVVAPEELLECCMRAMARRPEARHPNATALGEDIGAWLDGARRRERAMEVIEEARRKGPEAAELRVQASTLRARAQGMLAEVTPWQDEAIKAPAWSQEDAADALEQAAELREIEAEGLLRAALTHAPDLADAHAELAERYRREHAEAEQRRDGRAVKRAEARLTAHVWALPEAHPDRLRHTEYLQGDGRLTLVTDPAGARVQLYRYETRNRRLVAVFERSLGVTPLIDARLPMGSYLVVLEHSERAPVRYPVHLGRNEHHDGRRPGTGWPHPIYLPRRDELGRDDLYVPAGWFRAGEEGSSEALRSRRVWVDGFVIRRFPVTNREYMEFLDSLNTRGQEEELLRHAPRERAGTIERRGAMVYGRHDDGTVFLRPDSDGVLWGPDWPVQLVDWECAMAFARWTGERSGLPWRLPGELEWEKAARGVDGRPYPWGERIDPSWCCIRDSHAGRQMPVVVDSFPVDESPFGVRGMAGNVRDWCMEVFERDGPPVEDGVAARPAVEDPLDLSPEALRVTRGAGWFNQPRHARAALRGSYAPQYRLHNLGFRLARPFPE